jgi:formiminotetrahydrofolate cyclodeaminase
VAVNGLGSASSDVAVAIELLLTAAKGAAMNVDANLAALKDRGEQMRLERKELEAESSAAAQRARKSLMT